MKVKAISKHLARWLAVALPLHLYCGFQFAAETRWLKVWSLQAVRQFFSAAACALSGEGTDPLSGSREGSVR
jgi:hypothetical protein